MRDQFIGLHADFIGFTASLICAIHCAGLPILLSLTPLTGLSFLNDPWIEYAIILFSFLIASYALITGYTRHHKSQVLVIVTVGFALITIGHLSYFESMEIILTSCGAITVAIAHLVNWKHIR